MASKNLVEFTSANWEAEVAGSSIPVVVDFWAPWCGPCRALTPIIEKIADQFAGKVKVGKCNVDDNQDLAMQYGIVNIPRVLMFRGSAKPMHTIVGLASESDLIKKVNDIIAG
jgi:thioredoxin 1